LSIFAKCENVNFSFKTQFTVIVRALTWQTVNAASCSDMYTYFAGLQLQVLANQVIPFTSRTNLH
jgi:hypothetical protein